MVYFGISPDKEKSILSNMRRLGVNEKDVVESFIRSSGRGGQKVNKSSSRVYLKHIPTGIEVKFQKERSQALNRFLAWQLLLQKIESRILERRAEEKRIAEKIRRKKRKAPRSVRLRILEEKKRHSEKKSYRKRPDLRKID